MSLCTGDWQPERAMNINVTLSHDTQQLRWQLNCMAKVQQVTLALYMNADHSHPHFSSLLVDGSMQVC